MYKIIAVNGTYEVQMFELFSIADLANALSRKTPLFPGNVVLTRQKFLFDAVSEQKCLCEKSQGQTAKMEEGVPQAEDIPSTP